MMKRHLQNNAVSGLFALTMIAGNSAWAQKHGGVLNLYNSDNPGNLSPLEEPAPVTEVPMMGVFNNLIMSDQHQEQVSLQSIVPDLATSWAWNEDSTALTFKLRQGVKWQATRAPEGKADALHACMQGKTTPSLTTGAGK